MKPKLLCYILYVLLFVMLISACGRTVVNDTSETKKPDTKVEVANLLDLSPKNEKVFQDYRKSKSDELLEGLKPLTICAFYFLAEEYEDYETQYALIDIREPSLVPSKEEYLRDISVNNIKARDKFHEKLREQLNNVETDILDNEQCLIVLTFKDGQKRDFRLNRIEKDIWKVSYIPMQ